MTLDAPMEDQVLDEISGYVYLGVEDVSDLYSASRAEVYIQQPMHEVLKLTLSDSYSMFHNADEILKFSQSGANVYHESNRGGSITLNTLSAVRSSSNRALASITISADKSIRGMYSINGKTYIIESTENENIRNLEESSPGLYRTGIRFKSISPNNWTSLRRNLQARDPDIDLWTDCYPDDDKPNFIDIGIVTDLSYTLNFLNTELALDNIENFVSSANVVFASQLNIFLNLKQVVIVEEGDELPSGFEFFGFNRATCLDEPEDILTRLREWTSRLPNEGDLATEAVQQAAWHMLTACFAFGIVGSAFIESLEDGRGTLCKGEEGVNTAVTSLTSRGFVSFAHEIGHNLGAEHSFEDGEGTTGGIMDNGNGEVEGVIKFREERREEICTGLTNAKASCGDKFRTFDDICAFQNFCGVGFCENGRCVEMDFIFAIGEGTQNFVSRFADEEVAANIAVPTRLSLQLAVFQDEVFVEDQFGCSPDPTATIPANAVLFVEDSVDLPENCSYLERAQNFKARGIKVVFMFDSTLDDESVRSISLNENEIQAQSEAVEDISMVYVDNGVARFFRSSSLNIEIGWEFIDNGRLFSVHDNLEVPEVEGAEPSIIPIIVIPIVLVLVIVGIIFAYIEREPIRRRMSRIDSKLALKEEDMLPEIDEPSDPEHGKVNEKLNSENNVEQVSDEKRIVSTDTANQGNTL